MILEAVILHVKNGLENEFEADFKIASQYISSINGYVSHSLQKCIENKNQYLLLVQWDKLEDHTIGFRNSHEYQAWKKLLHHYYDPFPVVEHYEMVLENKK
ncbi:antibiotic biosynthesis monooxygenase family protein [Flavobacterium algicola]|uniref:antibiotic biosynthesis monooxygenase family protein n=1 Tax=Flavobacterium algicola TaxID=556529 RepID=UPI001EFEB26B|nr:antibiotic biosynthesis monooxygenase [Flavobacterium algicola]MCG9791657.1 antibiotic biosynthesis monooxygenase [Flavobacterium algicola]